MPSWKRSAWCHCPRHDHARSRRDPVPGPGRVDDRGPDPEAGVHVEGERGEALDEVVALDGVGGARVDLEAPSHMQLAHARQVGGGRDVHARGAAIEAQRAWGAGAHVGEPAVESVAGEVERVAALVGVVQDELQAHAKILGRDQKFPPVLPK